MISKRPTAGIVLAAGAARRFGKPKQLLRLKGRFLIQWVLEAALSSRLHEIILVLGHESRAIKRALGKHLRHHPRLQILTNPDYAEGMASSLRVGLRGASDGHPSVMFLLGDQPLVGPETIDLLLERFWGSEKDICVPLHQGRRGNPVLFSRIFYDRLLSIEGDVGAREIIEANPKQVLRVEVGDPQCFLDVDLEEDLRAVESLLP